MDNYKKVLQWITIKKAAIFNGCFFQYTALDY